MYNGAVYNVLCIMVLCIMVLCIVCCVYCAVYNVLCNIEKYKTPRLTLTFKNLYNSISVGLKSQLRKALDKTMLETECFRLV